MENEVLLSKLVETLNRLLPNGEWKKFTLQTNTTITHWHNPYIVRDYRDYPAYPYYGPWYTDITLTKTSPVTMTMKSQHLANMKNNAAYSLKKGVFAIEA